MEPIAADHAAANDGDKVAIVVNFSAGNAVPVLRGRGQSKGQHRDFLCKPVSYLPIVCQINAKACLNAKHCFTTP